MCSSDLVQMLLEVARSHAEHSELQHPERSAPPGAAAPEPDGTAEGPGPAPAASASPTSEEVAS